MRVTRFANVVRVGLAAGVAVVLASSCAGPMPRVGAAVPTAAPSPPTGAAIPATAAPTPAGTGAQAPTQGPDAPTTARLERGAEGSGVLALQERLTAMGYWLGEPDGRFGPSTEQAVFALQGVAGLSRDGVVGPATRAALDDGARPVPRSSTGVVTEIDRDSGVIAFLRDGAVELVLHTSTGTFEEYTHDGRRLLADTPEGRFAVSWSVDGWREGALGRLYRPRYFHPDGIAVHGYPSVPAYPASHGCARVTMAAMDMVWARDLMPSGSTVLVH